MFVCFAVKCTFTDIVSILSAKPRDSGRHVLSCVCLLCYVLSCVCLWCHVFSCFVLNSPTCLLPLPGFSHHRLPHLFCLISLFVILIGFSCPLFAFHQLSVSPLVFKFSLSCVLCQMPYYFSASFLWILCLCGVHVWSFVLYPFWISKLGSSVLCLFGILSLSGSFAFWLLSFNFFVKINPCLHLVCTCTCFRNALLKCSSFSSSS